MKNEGLVWVVFLCRGVCIGEVIWKGFSFGDVRIKELALKSKINFNLKYF